MIGVKHSGSFKNTEKFLKRASNLDLTAMLNRYGQEGVNALSSATPKQSGLTANSWSYEIKKNNGSYVIEWGNSHIVNYVKIAVILQYGHATRNGGWVEGVDYINPALQPIFNKIADDAWREVTK